MPDTPAGTSVEASVVTPVEPPSASSASTTAAASPSPVTPSSSKKKKKGRPKKGARPDTKDADTPSTKPGKQKGKGEGVAAAAEVAGTAVAASGSGVTESIAAVGSRASVAVDRAALKAAVTSLLEEESFMDALVEAYERARTAGPRKETPGRKGGRSPRRRKGKPDSAATNGSTVA